MAGVLAESIGPRKVLVGAGVIGLATTLIPLAVPGVARLADVDPVPRPTRGMPANSHTADH